MKHFLLTYGDGVANVDLEALLAFHQAHGKLVTMTAVRPNARFGELELNGTAVTNFQEKPQLHDGWVNGGFFVIEPEFFNLIEHDQIMLERQPMEKAAQSKQLMAFRHEGFWQCMDTKRDHQLLEDLWGESAPGAQIGKPNYMRILVTGGFGYLGANLSEYLSQEGHHVVLGSKRELKAPQLATPSRSSQDPLGR